MSFLKNLNKHLYKAYDGQVEAYEEGGCLVLSGELKRWNDIVYAGQIAIEKNPYFGFVNEIVCTTEAAMPIRKPKIDDSSLEREEPDVLIIGGGIIGCAIARELSRHKLNILLVEKEHDVAMQASGRNTGVVHSGVGLNKGSQRYRFSRLGNQMFPNLCKELEVDYIRSGQIAYHYNRLWDAFMPLSSIYWKWLGISDARILKRDDLSRYEPELSNAIGSAVLFPSAGVVNPFDLTIALAENAAQNGVTISLDTMVQSMTVEDSVIKSVKTNRGIIKPKLVINAAGVFAEMIAAMAGDKFFSIHPKKGTTAVLDKKYVNKMSRTVVTTMGKSPTKKKHLKGTSVIRTVNGNTLVGPDSFETIHKEDFSTSALNLKELISSQAKAFPEIDQNQIIAYYSGISAATYEDDFIISKGAYIVNIIHAAGMQFPGLTASPAVAAEVVKLAAEFFGSISSMGTNPDFNPIRSAPSRPSQMDDAARSALIESNPDYGIIICRCQGISKGEILNAMRREVKCTSLDGIKRRVRAGMGRCQGSYCSTQIIDLLASETRLPPQNIRKSGSGSEKLYGNAKALQQKRDSSAKDASFGRTDPETIARLQTNAKRILAAKYDSGKEASSNVNE